jgi:hypothetical protein
MMFTTIKELNEEFQRCPQSSSARLRLDHYLVLKATNELADRFLSGIESQGIVPLTVNWVSETGWHARLYLNPFEHSDMLNIPDNLFGMQFRFGSGEDCLVLNGEDSILDREVRILTETAMKWFWMWQSAANSAAAYLSTLGVRTDTFRDGQFI